MMTALRLKSALLCLMLCACGGAPEKPATNAAETAQVAPAPAAPSPVPTLAPAPLLAAGPLSCSADIGPTAADKRAKICRNVSPATRPPCNVANSCAMIEDEIARSCALFDGKGAPMDGCGPSPKSMEAAAAVVTRYYAALNARDFDTAWQQWGEGGPSGQTRATFEAGFARTRATRVTIGKLEPGDGGAGSIYQPVPVTVEATLDDGTRQRFTGEYVVRRINDVDGASSAQLRWHLGSARLRLAQ